MGEWLGGCVGGWLEDYVDEWIVWVDGGVDGWGTVGWGTVWVDGWGTVGGGWLGDCVGGWLADWGWMVARLWVDAWWVDGWQTEWMVGGLCG